MKLLKRLLKIIGGILLFLVLLVIVPLIGVGWQCKVWQSVDPQQSDLRSAQTVSYTHLTQQLRPHLVQQQLWSQFPLWGWQLDDA